jgi:hypothetical protein
VSARAPAPPPELRGYTHERLLGSGGFAGDLGVLDLGPQGLWRPTEGQGAELTWSPVTADDVWQELGRLFAAALEDRPAS